MAQAATPTRSPIPAAYGNAYRQIVDTALALTSDQYDALRHAWDDRDDQVYEPALLRTETALINIGINPDDLLTEPLPAVDAALAVLARDRGVISDGDFDTLTTAWSTIGLPLPVATTTNNGPIHDMTSDHIADQLTISGHTDPAVYGAVLMLTGYNHGELLAYPAVRKFVHHDTDGKLQIRWDELNHTLTNDDAGAQLGQLELRARAALAFAIDLRNPMTGSTMTMPLGLIGDDDNVETMAIAFAYAIGAGYLLDRTSNDDLPAIPASPAAAPVKIPDPRSGFGNGE